MSYFKASSKLYIRDQRAANSQGSRITVIFQIITCNKIQSTFTIGLWARLILNADRKLFQTGHRHCY